MFFSPWQNAIKTVDFSMAMFFGDENHSFQSHWRVAIGKNLRVILKSLEKLFFLNRTIWSNMEINHCCLIFKQLLEWRDWLLTPTKPSTLTWSSGVRKATPPRMLACHNQDYENFCWGIPKETFSCHCCWEGIRIPYPNHIASIRKHFKKIISKNNCASVNDRYPRT